MSKQKPQNTNRDNMAFGLEQRYTVTKNNGKPLNHGAIVLEWDDPNGRVGIRAFSDAVRRDGYIKLADDLDAELANWDNPDKAASPAGDVLPAGKYWIGDPCYVIENDLWSKWCSAHDGAEDEVFKFLGCRSTAFFTAHGDGIYTDQFGRIFCVDSGTIGAVPVSVMVTHKYDQDTLDELGHIVEFGEEFVVGKRGGVLMFGDIEIDTDN